MKIPEGWPTELVEFIKAKSHHLPIEDQHALSVMLSAAPATPAQDCNHRNKIGSSPDGKTEHITWKCFDCGQPTESPRVEALGPIAEFDAGELNTYGGGKVEWWLDYIRYLLSNAHEYYQEQFDQLLTPAQAGFSKEWCMKMAQLEGDQEIGAGRSSLIPPVQKDEPVAWIRGSGIEMLQQKRPATVFASEGCSNYSIPIYTRPQSDISAEQIAQMLEAIKEVDVLIRNNLPVDKTTPAWGMIKKILYK